MLQERAMKLYNWQFAPNCRRVRMFVLEKGLDLPAIEEVVGEGFRMYPQYIDKWPHALVPMMELDDGTQIGEAAAICRYIEDEYPNPPLMGRSGLEKATIEMWERRAYDECMIGTAEVVRNSMTEFYDRGIPGSLEPVPQIPALIERGRGRVRRFYKKYDTRLRETRYLAGDNFTMADITTLCAMDFAKFAGMDIPPDCTGVARWYTEVSERPSAKASI
jgi:glutathione S-transferase